MICLMVGVLCLFVMDDVLAWLFVLLLRLLVMDIGVFEVLLMRVVVCRRLWFVLGLVLRWRGDERSLCLMRCLMTSWMMVRLLCTGMGTLIPKRNHLVIARMCDGLAFPYFELDVRYCKVSEGSTVKPKISYLEVVSVESELTDVDNYAVTSLDCMATSANGDDCCKAANSSVS